MPRVSVRKAFVYLLAVASTVLLLLNVHQTLVGHYTWSGSGPSGSGSGPGGTGNSEPAKAEAVPSSPSKKAKSGAAFSQAEVERLLKDNSEHEIRPRRKLDLSPLDPDDSVIPEPAQRPWYMKGGSAQPVHAVVDPQTGRRNATLTPAEGASWAIDRIDDQLMFFPPRGVLPENIEDPSTPLKKILLWNGVGSWGQVRTVIITVRPISDSVHS